MEMSAKKSKVVGGRLAIAVAIAEATEHGETLSSVIGSCPGDGGEQLVEHVELHSELEAEQMRGRQVENQQPVEQEQHVEPDLTYTIVKFTAMYVVIACVNEFDAMKG